MQKQHLYMSVKEAYSLFKQENPNVKISLSKFGMVWPPNVLLSSQTPSNVCTCIYHQNAFLALDAIHNVVPDIPVYTSEVCGSCFIDPVSHLCWFGNCAHTSYGFEVKYPLQTISRDQQLHVSGCDR